jgi:D-beta-D-heptose 7-phosphate kinase / D-beta-D-heptose 1-phosphate adenosyltransferase
MSGDDFRRGRILVVGDAMLDRYAEGAIERISPEAPVPIVRVERCFHRVGGAANVALNAAALGASVTLVAWIGEDADGAILRSQLRDSGIGERLLTTANARTILKLRVLSQQQQVVRLDYEDGFFSEDPSRIAEIVEDELPRHDVVIFSDYGKGTLSDVETLIALSRRFSVPALVDPKGSAFTRYRGASVVTPNSKEFSAVAGEPADEEDFRRGGESLRANLDLEYLLVTRGEAGMTLFSGADETLHVPAHAIDVADVTGAGDTVIATLGSALAAGLPMPECVRLANRAAGIVVTRVGTATVTLEELLVPEGLGRSGFDADPVKEALAAARARGERIVMTNGCFDILHAGHVDFLTRAKALGDKLVVAVNSDASVRRLKGPRRPVNTLADRMALLRALKPVDFVLSFDGSLGVNGRHEDTPLDLIKEIRPHVLVKGGDYRIDQIVGAEDVRAFGGEVLTLPLSPGHSTTSLLERAARKTA